MISSISCRSLLEITPPNMNNKTWWGDTLNHELVANAAHVLTQD